MVFCVVFLLFKSLQQMQKNAHMLLTCSVLEYAKFEHCAVVEQQHNCYSNQQWGHSPAGLLRPLPVLQRPWSNISLDFVTGRPVSAKETAETCLFYVFRLHGLPRGVLSHLTPVSSIFASSWFILKCTLSLFRSLNLQSLSAFLPVWLPAPH